MSLSALGSFRRRRAVSKVGGDVPAASASEARDEDAASEVVASEAELMARAWLRTFPLIGSVRVREGRTGEPTDTFVETSGVRVVLLSQIQGMSSSEGRALAEVGELCRGGAFLRLSLPLAQCGDVLCETREYQSFMRGLGAECKEEALARALEVFVERVVASRSISVSSADLEEALAHSREAQRRETVAAGRSKRCREESGPALGSKRGVGALSSIAFARFLLDKAVLYRRADVSGGYSLGVPRSAELTRCVERGRRELVRRVRSTKYGEVLHREMLRREFSWSPFTMEWHLADAVGSGVLLTVTTASGRFIRVGTA
jgi:hypothetical protein